MLVDQAAGDPAAPYLRCREDRRRRAERSRRYQAGPGAGDARGKTRRTPPDRRPVLQPQRAASRALRGSVPGTPQVHQRLILRRGNGLPSRPPHQTSTQWTAASPRAIPPHWPAGADLSRMHAPAGITHRVRFSDVPGADDKGLEAVLRRTGPESAGTMFAPCLLGCRCTAR
jgi:hypothetical protein